MKLADRERMCIARDNVVHASEPAWPAPAMIASIFLVITRLPRRR